MSLDSTTSSTTTDPLSRPSAATTPDVDVAAQTTTPSTAPTTPPASPPLPPAQDLPYCASPQPATAAELPAETEYPPARIDDDDEDDNAPGPSVLANLAGSSSKEKRKGGGEGAEGEQARDKRVRKTRHKRRPSSQHRSVPIACINWQTCHGRKLTESLGFCSCQRQRNDGRHCLRGRGRPPDGQPVSVHARLAVWRRSSLTTPAFACDCRPARACARSGRLRHGRARR
jgi:hypothetical protein